MTSAFLPGLVTGLALIVAIGAQNAFVLRQGIRREHLGVVVGICIVSDIFLIGLGTAGIGFLIDRVPWLLNLLPDRRRYITAYPLPLLPGSIPPGLRGHLLPLGS